MSNRFVTLAIEWVDIPDIPDSNSMVDAKTGDDVDTTHPPDDDDTDAENVAAFKDSFSQLLNSLLLVQKVPLALEAYANRLADSIRLIVRTCLLEYINADVTVSGDSQSSVEAGAGDNSFSSKVRNMTNENFLSCLQMCLESLLQALRRSVAVHVFLCQVYAKIPHSTAPATNSTPGDKFDDEDGLQEQDGDGDCDGDEDEEGTGEKNKCKDMDKDKDRDRQGGQGQTDCDADAVAQIIAAQLWAVERSGAILTSISELAQKSICQLLLMRKESNAKLPLDQMKFLWDMVLNFVYTVDKFNTTLLAFDRVDQEDAGQKGGTPPSLPEHPEAIESSRMHVAVVNLSTFPLRNGLLNQTKKFIEYLHESCKGKLVNTLDNEKWLQCDVSPDRQAALDVLTSGRSLMKKQNTTVTAAAASGSGSSAGAFKSKKKELVPIVVDGNSFKIVWSVLFLVEVVLSYLDVAIQFAPVTKDIIAKTVEIVTLFDSRSKQLVLGAQAIQSAARLKSIAAKHLGIMAQSLTFLTAILPHLRAAFLSQLPPEHHLVLVEMDRVSKNIQDHHSKVLQKFVSIVGDFVDASAQKLVVLDWDRFNGQSEYFDEVCRNVSALHRVLSVCIDAMVEYRHSTSITQNTPYVLVL
jgi:vacuolar protein sorting-associated protein 54